MPTRRVRACANCRAAKARCSLTDPCSRCATRNLPCRYAPTQLPSRRIRLIKPAIHVGIDAEFVQLTRIPGYAAVSLDSQEILHHSDAVPASTRAHDPEILTYTKTSDAHEPWSADAGTQLSSTLSSPLSSSYCADQAASIPYLEPLSPSWFLNLDTPPRIVTPPVFNTICNFSSTLKRYGEGPGTKTESLPLSLRDRPLQQGALTAKIVFSKLGEYPRMLADGRHLPPFIFPPCWLHKDRRCTPHTPHVCLPGILNTCSHLVRAFYAQPLQGREGVWRQMCSHVQRLADEAILLLVICEP